MSQNGWLVMRIIKTDADVNEGAAWLATHDERLAYALSQNGDTAAAPQT